MSDFDWLKGAHHQEGPPLDITSLVNNVGTGLGHIASDVGQAVVDIVGDDDEFHDGKDDHDHLELPYKPADIVAFTGFHTQREVNVEVRLLPTDDYIVIPCTQYSQQQSAFRLQFYVRDEFHVSTTRIGQHKSLINTALDAAGEDQSDSDVELPGM